MPEYYNVDFHFIRCQLIHENWEVRKAALLACQHTVAPLDIIEKGLTDKEWCVRDVAADLCEGRMIPVEIVEKMLSNKDDYVRLCVSKTNTIYHVPSDTLRKWMKKNHDAFYVVMLIATKRYVSPDIIERGLRSNEDYIRELAIKACKDKRYPLDTIELWFGGNSVFKRAALMSLMGRADISEYSFEIAKRGLLDKNFDVVKMSMELIQSLGMEIPMIRTFEPPVTVYKKCLNGVIVAATIPPNAQIRGSIRDGGRADKATILKVEGDVCGENVGISMYDLKTRYYTGNVVNVENFDLSCYPNSSGFHFFCTLEQAREFEYEQ